MLSPCNSLALAKQLQVMLSKTVIRPQWMKMLRGTSLTQHKDGATSSCGTPWPFPTRVPLHQLEGRRSIRLDLHGNPP